MADNGSDHETGLVKRINQGDFEAFREVFDTHWTALCNVAAVYTHDMDIAEEIVADIFANLWIRRESLDINVKLRTYLHSAVSNRTQNFRRDHARRAELLQTLDHHEVPALGQASAAEQPLAQLEIQDSVDIAMNAINSLSDRYRLAFLYRWRDDWSYEDIAEALGVSVNGAQALVSRALKAIRSKLPSQNP